METWTKYTFICDPEGCDALAEYTVKDTYVLNKYVTNVTCLCGQTLSLLSVVDATIPSINQPAQQEENKMDTIAELYNPHAEVTYKKVAGTYAFPEAPEYVTEKVTDLEWTLDQARKSIADRTLFENQRFLIDNIINSSYEDSEDKDTLREIAKVLDISLTKEVSWTATVTISGTVDVDLTDEDFDLESHVSDEISGSLYDYDFSIDDIEEN